MPLIKESKDQRAEITMKSVMGGFPDVPTEDIATDIELQGLSFIEVKAMKTKFLRTYETSGIFDSLRSYLISISVTLSIILMKNYKHITVNDLQKGLQTLDMVGKEIKKWQ